jgi:hypothetical protein
VSACSSRFGKEMFFLGYEIEEDLQSTADEELTKRI